MSNPDFSALLAVARHALGQPVEAAEHDYAALLPLAERHRLRPHLHRFLHELEPDHIPPEVEDFARANAEHNLALVAVTLAVVHALKAAEVPCIVLKGPLLARELYGDLSMRESNDVDVLIPRAFAEPACAALQAAGWQAEHDVERIGVDRILANRHDIAFRNQAEHVLELHCDAVQPHYAYHADLPGWFERARFTELGGEPVPVLDHVDAALFALMHGTKHLWSRLDLLLDYVALRGGVRRPDILDASAATAGLRRAADAAAALAAHLLVAAPPPESAVSNDWIAARLEERLRNGAEGSYWENRILDLFIRERATDRLHYASAMAGRMWQKLSP